MGAPLPRESRTLSGRTSGAAAIVWIALFILFGLSAPACKRAPSSSDLPAPRLVLWAWERPEDLRFLSQPSSPSSSSSSSSLSGSGVAYLQSTVFLYKQHVVVRRRAAGLQLPDGIWRMPVVRIESDRTYPPTLEDGQRAELLRVLKSETEQAGIGRLQIDFEASASQRAFYRQLLGELRAALGPGFFLSVTALTSWCLSDRFMADLPVDEIVPMFYRLGSEGPKLRAELSRGSDLAPECRRAHGLYTEEPMVPPPTPRRLYLFSRLSWTAPLLERALERLPER
jgi:hypothetical protein